MAKGLSAEVVARAALAVVDAEGLPALSMRRLATELGVDPMAPYKHVTGKDALLDAVMDAVLGEVDLHGLPGGVEERLAAGVRRILSALTAHPRAARLFSVRQWLSPQGLRIVEWGLAELIGAGVDPRRAALAMNATGLFLTGLAQAVTAAADPDGPQAVGRESAAASGSTPLLAATLAAGQAPAGYDEIVDFWLEALLTLVREAAPDGADDGADASPSPRRGDHAGRAAVGSRT